MGKGHIPEDTFVYARVYVHVRARVPAVHYVVEVPACVSFPFKNNKSARLKVCMLLPSSLPLKFSCVCVLACLWTVVCAYINTENVDVCEKAPSAPPSATVHRQNTDFVF